MYKQMKRAKLVKGKDVPQKERRGEKLLIVDKEGSIIGEKAEPIRAKIQDSPGKTGSNGAQKPERPAEQMTAEELALKEETNIPKDFGRLKRVLEEKVGLNKSFDVVFRETVFGGQKTGVF